MFSAPFAAEKRKHVEAYLHRLVTERFPTAHEKTAKLSESAAYSLLAFGKRIRPIITLSIIELYRPLDDEAVRLSITTELMHTASLMLDDLPSMDNAQVRRGRPTNHVVFGESTTILAAMALWSEAIRLLATIERVEINEIVRELSESVGQKGLARGQFMDLDTAHRPETLAELEEASHLKTGVLFKAAAKIGALLGGAPPSDRKILARYGKEFGLVYQIRDDILDVESQTKETGKDSGSDARNARTTYVTLLGVERAKKRIAEKLDALAWELKGLSSPAPHLEELAGELAM